MEITAVFLNKRVNQYKIYKISEHELFKEMNRLAKSKFMLTSVDGMRAEEYLRQNTNIVKKAA